MSTQRISELEIADISSDGSGTAADLEAFQTACYNYVHVHACSEAEAIDAIWDGGDFGKHLYEWGDNPAADAAGWAEATNA